jgi:hypothetical protein
MERIHHSSERFWPGIGQARAKYFRTKSRLERSYVQLDPLVHRILLNVVTLPERNRESRRATSDFTSITLPVAAQPVLPRYARMFAAACTARAHEFQEVTIVSRRRAFVLHIVRR